MSTSSTEEEPQSRPATARVREPYATPTLRTFGSVGVLTENWGGAGSDLLGEASIS